MGTIFNKAANRASRLKRNRGRKKKLRAVLHLPKSAFHSVFLKKMAPKFI